MILPFQLQNNDKIGVLALSNPVYGTEVSEWVNRGVQSLKDMNFEVVLGSTLFTKNYYTSGTTIKRWNDFKKMIQDPSIKVIMTAIGGENAHQLLPLIDFELIIKNPKIIIGYSDPTVLLNPISERCNMPTFYGHHVISFDPKWTWYSEYSINCFKNLLMNSQMPFVVPPSDTRECWKDGIAQGRLVGGCLIDLIKLLGTPWEPDWKGKILILESVNQSPQSIDVSLTHLHQAGAFNEIKGLILGKFHNCIASRKKDRSLKKNFSRYFKKFKISNFKNRGFWTFF